MALKDYFKEKDDWYEKCLKCQHSYRKNNDSDMIYCRCRRGKCNFKEVENKNAEREKAINEWLETHCQTCVENLDRGTGFVNCQAECEVQKDIGIACIHYDEYVTESEE